MRRLIYRLAAFHRIPDVESWIRTVSLRQVLEWHAYWRVEPYGDDWRRTALQTLFILKALGANVDDGFVEMFLPNYDPNREMTEDEINAELTKFSRRM